MNIIGSLRTDGPVTCESLKPVPMTTAIRIALSNSEGQTVYDSDTKTLWRNTGSGWIELMDATPAALTFVATTQPWNARTHPRATLILTTGNTTLQAPTNAVVGQTYTLLARASGAPRTLSFVSTYVNALDNSAIPSLVIPDSEFRAMVFMWDSARMRLIGV